MMRQSFCIVSIYCLAILLFAQCVPTSTNIDCKELIISPVAVQEILANTRSYIPLAAMANNLDQVKFTISEGPSFIRINNTQRGRAFLQIDGTFEDIGEHSINIEASNGFRSGCIKFMVQIIDINASTRIIHCDPSVAKTGHGSLGNPYGSISQLFASGFKPQPKDLIVLHEGNHGNVVLTGLGYTVVTASGDNARLSSLLVKEGSEISIKGLEIRPINDQGDHNEYLTYIDSSCHQINFSNNIVLSTHDAAKWNQEDWTEKASRGIKCLADESIIENNLIQHIFHGIKTEGNKISIRYNHVDRFGGDAIRNMGSSNTFSYNFLTNATVDDYYDEGGNHDDLFQSWTFSEPVDKLRLNNNIMISCLDTLMPQRAKIVQGLVCFDGFETNWIVNNNLVITDHPHGIALYGAKNCEVYENTVLKNPYKLYHFESDPWIMINNHKDGRKSKNNTVRNNITSAMNIVSEDVSLSENTVLDSTLLTKLNQYYEWDFRIKK